MNYVLDASALLAYLHQEPGWQRVQQVIATSRIGAVNWSEVARKATHKGLNAKAARTLLTEIGLIIEPFSTEQAETAARLWARTRGWGLSLADRACLALAIERQALAVTSDQTWDALDVGIEIELLR